MRKRLMRVDVHCALDLCQDDPKMCDNDQILPRVFGDQRVNGPVYPVADIIPAFAIGRADITGVVPIGENPLRVLGFDIRESPHFPCAEIDFPQALMVRQTATRALNGRGRIRSSGQIGRDHDCLCREMRVQAINCGLITEISRHV